MKNLKIWFFKKFSNKKKISLVSQIVKFQQSLKPEFNFKINFSLEKYIQAFFDGIANRIVEYKILKAEEKKRKKIEEIEKKEKEKLLIQKQKIKEEEEQTKLKEKALKEEARLEKERARDIKLFLRKEQALVRIEQAERQKQFLKQLQLEKQIEKYNLDSDVNRLADLSRAGNHKILDMAGRIAINTKGEVIYNFGKHKGKTVEQISKSEPGYYGWMLEADFPLYTKSVLRKAMESIKEANRLKENANLDDKLNALQNKFKK